MAFKKKNMLSLKLVQNLVIFQKPIQFFYLRIFRGNFPSGSANLAIQKQKGTGPVWPNPMETLGSEGYPAW